MPYILDEKDKHYIDENDNKIIYSISYENDDWYEHKEALHVNEDGHYGTRDKHIIIQDGTQANHPISMKQLDNTMIGYYSIKEINDLLTALKKSFWDEIINFRNSQILDRVVRKFFTIPHKTNKWIKILDRKEISPETQDLNDIVILNVFIRRWDRYHLSTSAITQTAFNNSLESFYSSNMHGFYLYFSSYPSDWSLESFIEYIRIPKKNR